MEEKMKRIFLILGIVSLLISCKKEEKELLPLEVGNYWLYNGWVVEDSDTTLIDTFKMRVINQNKDTFYLTGSLFTFDELTEEETMKVFIADSFYLTFSYDEPDTQVVLPFKTGKIWSVNDEYKGEVIGKEDVNIGNKKYTDCWRIKYQEIDGDIQKELWFKEEVGIVKFRREDNGETTLLELKEYNLKK